MSLSALRSLRRVVIPVVEIHAKIARLTNAGPLSEHMNSGAPCTLTRRESTSITRLERMVYIDCQTFTGGRVPSATGSVGRWLWYQRQNQRCWLKTRHGGVAALKRYACVGGFRDQHTSLAPQACVTNSARSRFKYGCVDSRNADSGRSYIAVRIGASG